MPDRKDACDGAEVYGEDRKVGNKEECKHLETAGKK